MMDFECHITIEPVFDKDLRLVTAIADKHGFRVADLLMKKRREDTPERSSWDTFMTARSSSYDVVHRMMMLCVEELLSLSFKVWRRKIELILLDERTP